MSPWKRGSKTKKDYKMSDNNVMTPAQETRHKAARAIQDKVFHLDQRLKTPGYTAEEYEKWRKAKKEGCDALDCVKQGEAVTWDPGTLPELKGTLEKRVEALESAVFKKK